MKKILIITLLVISTLILYSCESGPVEYGDVQGTIEDYDNNRVENAVVTIDGKTDNTDSLGRYYIPDVVARNHNIDVRKEGYTMIGTERYYISPNTITTIPDIHILKKNNTGSISGRIGITSGSSSSITGITTEPSQISSVENVTSQSYDLPEYVEGEVLVKFHSGVTAQHVEEQIIGKISSVSKQGIYKITSTNTNSMTTEELYNYYSQKADVEAVSYNHIGQLAAVPNDYYVDDVPLQWNIYNANLPMAWDIETGSPTVRVAVIDTGFLHHNDLDVNINTGLDYDFVDDDDNATDEDAYYNTESDYLTSHGTHVAGIIGAEGNNQIGIAGVNWNVDIMPIRIFRYNGDYQWFEEEDLVDAIGYAIENGADVINLSLVFGNNKGPSEYPFVEEVLRDAYNEGITIVAAAGNDGRSSVYYPASSPYTIAVGASTLDDRLSSYSNYGSNLDVIAPGGDEGDINNDNRPDYILSTHRYGPDDDELNDYIFMSGTSMAAPMVSGVAALLYAQGETNPGTIKDIITNSATSINDNQNAGLLNAYKALTYNSDDPFVELYSRTRIMAAIKEGNTYYIMSTISGADGDGDYNLEHVQEETDIDIIGWMDEENNGKIDSGDYFGEYQYNPIELHENERRSGIDFDISYISTRSTAAYKGMKVVYGPPPSNNEKGE